MSQIARTRKRNDREDSCRVQSIRSRRFATTGSKASHLISVTRQFRRVTPPLTENRRFSPHRTFRLDPGARATYSILLYEIVIESRECQLIRWTLRILAPSGRHPCSDDVIPALATDTTRPLCSRLVLPARGSRGGYVSCYHVTQILDVEEYLSAHEPLLRDEMPGFGNRNRYARMPSWPG